MGGWLLEVPEFDGADRWRWRLTDPDGVEVAAHQVALDPAAPEYEAFVDLAGHLRRRADPDRRVDSEAELVERLGAWAGERVLGPLADPLADAAPAVVRVEVPEGAEALLDRPLELAHARGRPLARQELSLVFVPAGQVDRPARTSKAPVKDQLRLLAVFSLPVETVALAIRRERYELMRLVRRVATRHRRAIQLEVVHYGATRDRLADLLEQGDGWDVVHFSGHGLAGGLLLEQADGAPDLIATGELAELLGRTRRRLKLVTLSSSQSAAASVIDVRRWLGLPVPRELEADADANLVPGDAAGRRSPLPVLAAELARRLGCAVLAMRYPVRDDFGVALTERLYEQLVVREQPLPVALQRALPAAAGARPTSGAPALSIATPALFGSLATDLSLAAPPGSPASFDLRQTPMSWFPPEPERFVGRAAPMARASAALAPANRHVGVLFHGMAGAGKTACALELAYRHERAFEAPAFWKAPELADPDSIAPALVNLAMALEAQLPGLEMVQAVADRAQLARFLPRLTELLEQRAVLLVLDNLESLLTDQGTWRDPRWADLMAALTGHRGESRVVLTSRVRPQGLDPRVRVEPVHALSLTESLLLARELRHLGGLLRDQTGTSLEGGQRRELVRRSLVLVQGHPKLLELADALAADPAALAAQLAAADQATEADDRDRLAAFFDQGETELSADHFVRALGDWTRRATATLPEPETFLFELLCCIEDSDRFDRAVERVWPALWRGRGQYGDPPTLATTLAPLVERGLVAVEADPAAYRIHPGVAEAGRAQANRRVRRLVDQVLALYWQDMFRAARELQAPEGGIVLLQAGRRAAPYLLRLEEWAAAGELLGRVLLRDSSPGTLQAVLPLLRRIAEATHGTGQEPVHAGQLAAALGNLQPEAAREQLGQVLDLAVAEERFDHASRVAGELVKLLRDAGRVEEALALSERKAEYTSKAGLGPWTQLLDQGRRQQLLSMQGHSDGTLAWVREARDRMAALPEGSEQPEHVEPWNVREIVLRIGSEAAGDLGRWQEALDLDAEAVTSYEARGATVLELAFVHFNGSLALIQLGERERAERLLLICREVFEAEGALGPLGKTLATLAYLEGERGHRGEALRLDRVALRYAYAARDPEGIADGHNNLANSLHLGGEEAALVLAHRLAAAVILYQLGAGKLDTNLDGAAWDLAAGGEPPPLPGSFGELCRRLGQTEGVRLADLTARLPRHGGEDDMLSEVLRLVAERSAPARHPEDTTE